MLLGAWLAALGLVIYFFTFQSSRLLLAMLAVVWLGGGWIALRAWRASAVGLLQWDGEHWHWVQNAEARTCQVRMVWDFQQWVLVRVNSHHRLHSWLWLESGGSMLQWNALRRALVSTNTGFTEPSPVNDLEDQR